MGPKSGQNAFEKAREARANKEGLTLLNSELEERAKELIRGELDSVELQRTIASIQELDNAERGICASGIKALGDAIEFKARAHVRAVQEQLKKTTDYTILGQRTFARVEEFLGYMEIGGTDVDGFRADLQALKLVAAQKYLSQMLHAFAGTTEDNIEHGEDVDAYLALALRSKMQFEESLRPLIQLRLKYWENTLDAQIVLLQKVIEPHAEEIGSFEKENMYALFQNTIRDYEAIGGDVTKYEKASSQFESLVLKSSTEEALEQFEKNIEVPIIAHVFLQEAEDLFGPKITDLIQKKIAACKKAGLETGDYEKRLEGLEKKRLKKYAEAKGQNLIIEYRQDKISGKTALDRRVKEINPLIKAAEDAGNDMEELKTDLLDNINPEEIIGPLA